MTPRSLQPRIAPCFYSCTITYPPLQSVLKHLFSYHIIDTTPCKIRIFLTPKLASIKEFGRNFALNTLAYKEFSFLIDANPAFACKAKLKVQRNLKPRPPSSLGKETSSNSINACPYPLLFFHQKRQTIFV